MELKEILQPISMEQASEMLATYTNSRVIAGGTDLVIELGREKLKDDRFVSLMKIEEIKKIKEEDHRIVIGSCVTFSELKENPIILENFRAIVQCAETMGSPQIRNMATIGGNIANAGSAADIVPCLIALNAELKIVSKEESRTIKLEEYFKEYNDKKVRQNEIIKEIYIPKNQGTSGFYKLGKRNSLAISRVSACIWIKLRHEVIEEAKLALGAVGRHAFGVEDFEQLVKGKAVTTLFSEKVLESVEQAVCESIKGRKTLPFKRQAVKGVYKLAAEKALE